MAYNATADQKAYARSVNEAIRVNGLTELVKAFRALSPELKREMQKELRKIAEPAAARARQIAYWKLAPIGMSQQFTIMGIRPGSRLGMAIVRQRRRATTHKRPKFGPWQVAEILYPAAQETMPEAREQLGAMLDRIADGFNRGVEI